MAKIRIIIGKDGNVNISVEEVRGQKCLDLTSELEKDLGLDEKNRILTEEFYLTETETKTGIEIRSEVEW